MTRVLYNSTNNELKFKMIYLNVFVVEGSKVVDIVNEGNKMTLIIIGTAFISKLLII